MFRAGVANLFSFWMCLGLDVYVLYNNVPKLYKTAVFVIRLVLEEFLTIVLVCGKFSFIFGPCSLPLHMTNIYKDVKLPCMFIFCFVISSFVRLSSYTRNYV